MSDKNFEDSVLCTQLQTCDGGVAYAGLFHNTFTYIQSVDMMSSQNSGVHRYILDIDLG